MFILITEAKQAGRSIKRIAVEDEKAIVGVVTEVSDKFVSRLEAEFPWVKFDKNVTPPEESPSPAAAVNESVETDDTDADKSTIEKGATA